MDTEPVPVIYNDRDETTSGETSDYSFTALDSSPVVQSIDRASSRQLLQEAMLAGEAYNNLPDDSAEKAAMRDRHVDRIKDFLRFTDEPGSGEKIDYIIVAGASPYIDRVRYDARIKKGVELAAEFPESKVIFSGRMPHESRRTGAETLSEAEMMMTDAETYGLDIERAIKEPDSNHLKENIEFSIRKVLGQIQASQESIGITVVSSQSTLRRAYYSAMQVLGSEFPEFKDKIKFYFSPSDDDLDDSGLVFYEMRRLSEYRSKGWL